MGNATVPASEYDALAEAFAAFVADREFVAPGDIRREQLASSLPDLATDEVDFIADALQRGSRALSTRTESGLHDAALRARLLEAFTPIGGVPGCDEDRADLIAGTDTGDFHRVVFEVATEGAS